MEKILLSVHWHENFLRHCLGSSDVGAREIIAWVSDDLFDMHEEINTWIRKFSSMASGTVDGHLANGNAHSVYLVGENVYIECEYVDRMKVYLSRVQIVDALEKYEIFLSFDLKDQKSPPPAFEVEYIASGEKASELFLEDVRAAGMVRQQSS